VNEIVVKQMPAFKKAYKKLHTNQKNKVNEAIRSVIKNPRIGEEKKGDLAGVFVYKFKIHHQEMLLAYEWSMEERLLLALGVHESFYRNLKKVIL
jgi:mRNA-degrading endonuclease RelE of RelBE toxin-antitoxin system